MVTINGNQTILSTDLTVAEYLEQNNYQTNRIVVELNEEILPKYLYSETRLKDGDSMEIVTFVGGGFLTVDSDYVLHLTETGRNVAEKIYERHQFFTEQFIAAGVDPEIAERDACRIEHAISQDTFEKIRDAHKQEK